MTPTGNSNPKTHVYAQGQTNWVNPNVARLVANEATMNSGTENCTATKLKTIGETTRTRTCTFVWTEPLNIALTEALISDLSHGRLDAHGSEFWHIYEDSSGDADDTPHRHCLTHDVNGDGDTDDPADNDGTCPGPDTDVPDLAWHRPLPNKDDDFWRTLGEGVFITTAGTAAGALTTAALSSLGAGASTANPAGLLVGSLVSIGLTMYLWLGDVGSVVTIAGHTNCLNPAQGTPWSGDRWARVQNSFTETKQTHIYETVYKHIIYSCDKVEST